MAPGGEEKGKEDRNAPFPPPPPFVDGLETGKDPPNCSPGKRAVGFSSSALPNVHCDVKEVE